MLSYPSMSNLKDRAMILLNFNALAGWITEQRKCYVEEGVEQGARSNGVAKVSLLAHLAPAYFLCIAFCGSTETRSRLQIRYVGYTLGMGEEVIVFSCGRRLLFGKTAGRWFIQFERLRCAFSRPTKATAHFISRAQASKPHTCNVNARLQ